MRATITRHLEALKKRRSDDKGFSLIELIVVVAILGILVAIAIPVFGAIQESARENSLKAAAANGATAVSAALADDDAASTPTTAVTAANDASDEIDLTTANVAGDTLDEVCVTASPSTTSGWTTAAVSTGPGC